MTSDYPKININYKLEERRNIGRPQTKWEDNFPDEVRGQSLIVVEDILNVDDIKNKCSLLLHTGCNKKVRHKLQNTFLAHRRRNYVI
jgi:hypothetical protein